jgi:hypothetical protein
MRSLTAARRIAAFLIPGVFAWAFLGCSSPDEGMIKPLTDAEKANPVARGGAPSKAEAGRAANAKGAISVDGPVGKKR